MTLKEKFKEKVLHLKTDILYDRIMTIGKMVDMDDEVVYKTPILKWMTLKWVERLYELQIELYTIYINCHKIDHARYILVAQENLEKALYLLKTE